MEAWRRKRIEEQKTLTLEVGIVWTVGCFWGPVDQWVLYALFPILYERERVTSAHGALREDQN